MEFCAQLFFSFVGSLIVFSEGFQFNAGDLTKGVPLASLESVTLSPSGLAGRMGPRKRKRKQLEEEEESPTCEPTTHQLQGDIPQPENIHGFNGMPIIRVQWRILQSHVFGGVMNLKKCLKCK